MGNHPGYRTAAIADTSNPRGAKLTGASVAMSGPFVLTKYGIAREVPKKTPGAYILGGVRLKPNYEGAQAVGRAETDLAAVLQSQIGLYEAFLFQPAGSAEDAFRLECELYHRLDWPDLKHPQRPSGTDWRVPVFCPPGHSEPPDD